MVAAAEWGPTGALWFHVAIFGTQPQPAVRRHCQQSRSGRVYESDCQLVGPEFSSHFQYRLHILSGRFV